ncbi:MAG: hypothetical protein M3Q91_10735 [Acidobacteriota bacterium]|nr:hypothetical protein [Acidobacteriota bacterium]
MKRFHRPLVFSVVLLTIIGLLFTSLPRPVARAQDDEPQSDVQLKPILVQARGFAETIPLRDMPEDSGPTESIRKNRPENVEFPEKVVSPPLSGITDSEQSLTASVQESVPEPNIPAPSSTFEGLSNQDNFNEYGFRVLPPDTVGDVGPTQYVQAVNLLFRVYDKNTGAPLTPPRRISTLFASLGGRCATRNDGDPIVLYDSFANRWMISQFIAGGPPPLGQCIAISKTSDATGAYFVYDFVAHNNKFGDYPKYGVWPDAYYSAVNQFAPGFAGVGVFAYDREKMLRGDPTASYIYFDLVGLTSRVRSMLPSDADGLNPPPAGAPNIFTNFNANEFLGDSGDSLLLFEFRPDFDTPANSTFTERADSPLAVAAFDPLNPPGFDEIEQPLPSNGTTDALDSLSDRLMHRFQYRDFGSYEAFTVTHTVNAGHRTPGFLPTIAQYRAGIRYYELRRNPPGGNFTVREQATFAPGTDTIERWMGSAAMDNQGNLAVGYSVTSRADNVFPGIRYAGRLVNDPLGGLSQGETVLQNGTFVQLSAASRWGDYSAMTVDPTDDCTFYYTQEYYQADNPATVAEWQTRVGNFKFTECTAQPKGTLTVNVTDCDNGQPLAGSAITIDNNLYGTVLANGSFSTQLAPGTYTVTISDPNATGHITRTVTITNGGTITLTECLSGLSDPVGAGLTLVDESCPPANGAPDPGERVTVSLAIRNTSDFAALNLTGTLQSSANVIAPSGPQNYGDLAPGATASRNYSFTANGNCGDAITLTLLLQEGSTVVGTVNYTIVLGALVTTSMGVENFDGVVAPALPPGWTTSVTGTPPPLPTPPPPPPAPWTTINTPSNFVDTPPNSAATTDNAFVATSTLVSPVIGPLPDPSGVNSGVRLTFRNFFNLEPGFDGGVLEISINGGAFQDIIAAGGSFVSGGYTGTLDTGFGNPLPGRQAWTGNSGGFITSTVTLPNSAEGQNVQFRWRMGNDSIVEVANGGWRIDTISISSNTRVCNPACHITMSNSGTATADYVVLTTAKLGGIKGITLPQTVGTLTPGASSVKTVTFKGAPSGMTTLQVGGT